MIHEMNLSEDLTTVEFKTGLSDKMAFKAKIKDIDILSPERILNQIKESYEVWGESIA